MYSSVFFFWEYNFTLRKIQSGLNHIIHSLVLRNHKFCKLLGNILVTCCKKMRQLTLTLQYSQKSYLIRLMSVQKLHKSYTTTLLNINILITAVTNFKVCDSFKFNFQKITMRQYFQNLM